MGPEIMGNMGLPTLGLAAGKQQQGDQVHTAAGKAKANAYNTCITPQAAYRSCSGAVHVTD